MDVSRRLIAVLLAVGLVGPVTMALMQVPRAGSLTALGANLPGWTNVPTPSAPPAMAGALMAYSPSANRFLLFGGWNGTTGLNGTWEFDPANGTWTQLHPASSPESRGDGDLVYDSRADAFILFGGWHEGPNETYTRLSDTWEFFLGNDSWTRRHPALSPSPRSDAEVAYSPVADAVLLVGGFNGTAYLGDVWSYFPGNDTWVPRPAAVQPSPRSDGRMVYVTDQDRFLLFGGNDYSGPNFSFHHLADTWSYAWSSNAWTQVASPVAPDARDYPIFSYDAAAREAILTGGFGNNVVLADVWGFNVTSDAWANFTPAVSAPARFAAAGGFDSARGALVVFGGAGNHGLLGDTWFFVLGTPTPAPPPMLPLPLLVGALGAGAAVLVAVAAVIRTRRRSRSKPGTVSPESGESR